MVISHVEIEMEMMIVYLHHVHNHNDLSSSTITLTHNDCSYAYNAMRHHESQFVWYRQLFILFSSYTYMNTLEYIDMEAMMNEYNLNDGDADVNADNKLLKKDELKMKGKSSRQEDVNVNGNKHENQRVDIDNDGVRKEL